MQPATMAEMMRRGNIVGIKEASGNIEQIVNLAAMCPECDIYSGNDDQIVPIMSLGGKGVISVLSNLLPAETSKMCRLCLEGNYPAAAKMQLEYLSLINALFCEVNPIPAKAAMHAMGFGANSLRLPLTPMEAAHEEILLREMRACGINV